MLVRFRTDYLTGWLGFLRAFHEGDVVDVPDYQADAWIRRGVAEAVVNEPPQKRRRS